MAIKYCEDCDYVEENDLSITPSNGVCRKCHGVGCKLDVMDVLVNGLAGTSQECEECGGSRICQTCQGKGYIDTGIWD